MEFASVGVPYDIKAKSLFKNTLPNENLKKGDSFWGGLNKAHNPPEAVGDALDTDRAAKLKQNTSNVTPPANTGPRIDQSSKENAELNANLSKQQQSTTVNNINPTSTQSSTPTSSQPKQDDRSPMQRKMQG
jgi:hypothetical protein